MDRKLSKDQEVQRLIRIAEASRSCLGNELTSLKQRLDFPAQIRGSLKKHPTGWLLGSLASGFAASLFFRRKPVAAQTKRRGLLLTLLGLALTAARPLAKVWLLDQAKSYLSGRSGTLASKLQRSRFQSQNPL